MTTLHTCKPVPHLDARLTAAAEFVRPGSIAADIGCDHGKLSAWLAGSGCCPLVFACDLREGPLQKARMTCAPWADKIQFRLGSGLSVLQPGEATEIIIAGMGAETVLEILDAAPWVRNEQYNFVFVPATKHSVLRKGLAQRGFALKSETLCRAAGRLYTVINAQYTGRTAEPTGLACLCGKTQGQPEAQAYREQQLVKLKKYRLGLAPGPQADGVDALIQEMEDGLWP